MGIRQDGRAGLPRRVHARRRRVPAAAIKGVWIYEEEGRVGGAGERGGVRAVGGRSGAAEAREGRGGDLGAGKGRAALGGTAAAVGLGAHREVEVLNYTKGVCKM